MTNALCVSCGEIKFGAFCPCGKCGVESTGNQEVDIVFSDHNLATESLVEFGNVIKAINASEENKELRYWIFIQYVSINHPDILTVELKSDNAEEIKNRFNKMELPKCKPQKPGRVLGSGSNWGCIAIVICLLGYMIYRVVQKFA